MSIFFYNGELDKNGNSITNGCGSFKNVSLECNDAAKKLGVFSPFEKSEIVIYIDAYDTGKRFSGKKTVPWLVSEYNCAPKICVEKLKIDNPLCLAISEQARQSYINAGYDENLIKTVHLGTNPQKWHEDDIRIKKQNIFTFLTVNTSNQRSGYNYFIPAYLQWARNRNVELIIKDQFNQDFLDWLKEVQAILGLSNTGKIRYIGNLYNENNMRSLYRMSHVHAYINTVTSFGMNLLDSAMCGLPNIYSDGSAIKEFMNHESNVPVSMFKEPIDYITISEWNNAGLKNNLLSLDQFSQRLEHEVPHYQGIIKSLDYVYNNYLELKRLNKEFQNYLKKNYTWENVIKNIMKELK